MKLLRIYEAKVRDEWNVKESFLICHGIATSKKEFTEIYGEIDSRPVDVTAQYFVSDKETIAMGIPESSPQRLFEDLRRCGWGGPESEYISELLRAALAAQNR